MSLVIIDVCLLLADHSRSKYASNKRFDVVDASVGRDVAAACF